jgi:Uri superfamily endonuclease
MYPDELNPAPGTYVLVCQSGSRASIPIGRTRRLELEPGFYCYVGSAFGTGGVRARVLRHVRGTGPVHWHIDYLRGHVIPVAVWFSHDDRRLEHDFASALSATRGFVQIDDFGCSDCGCRSHLFFCARRPSPAMLRRRIDSRIVLAGIELSGLAR